MDSLNLDKRFVEQISRRKRHRGISSVDLAKRLDIDESRLGRILRGECGMRADELVKLCAFFGIEMKDLVSKELLQELMRYPDDEFSLR
ncbi:MAG: helix-turn-helix transcriptional regulator [Ellagibacter isourolithinifaciens]|nr:helix-turn-helix transcriptional regulator [Ellagibacter isourolithinifaciens]MDD5925523.1 helix-turn-helix transcriptional regulator [Ellagibacter isourolithinifaciens]